MKIRYFSLYIACDKEVVQYECIQQRVGVESRMMKKNAETVS